MKRVLIALFFVPSLAFAGALTCKITDAASGKSAKATLNTSEKDAQSEPSAEIHHISLMLLVDKCTETECTVEASFDNSESSDADATETFTFHRGHDIASVISKTVKTEKAKFKLACSYKSSR